MDGVALSYFRRQLQHPDFDFSGTVHGSAHGCWKGYRWLPGLANPIPAKAACPEHTCHRSVPVANELEAKNAQTMKIMDSFGPAAS